MQEKELLNLVVMIRNITSRPDNPVFLPTDINFLHIPGNIIFSQGISK